MIAEGLVRGSRAGPSFVSVRMRRDVSLAERTSIGARIAHATRIAIGNLQCLIVGPIASKLRMTHRATALLRGNETLAKMGLVRGRAEAQPRSSLRKAALRSVDSALCYAVRLRNRLRTRSVVVDFHGWCASGAVHCAAVGVVTRGLWPQVVGVDQLVRDRAMRVDSPMSVRHRAAGSVGAVELVLGRIAVFFAQSNMSCIRPLT
jgi:hypothetical protein